MSATSAMIRILPAQLANQIAAGEVVERPASVVKELVENSLDSGASQIDIEIDKGGHKRICIRDNGGGIEKDQLALALSRHATSKISSLDDLEHIHSLGFRGEALASISSVARLTLTSKPKSQQQAWQAHAQGRDMEVQLNPVAHPDGTCVEVIDLFFNTPARRKFLRAEKTEFNHIDEIIRRISLSRFDVSFSLKHNGKLLRKYPALTQHTDHLKRLGAICNKDFASTAIALDSHYQDMTLSGWIAPPDVAHQQSDVQYFYVNGRMMRDKLINHAIRQAFEGVIHPDSSPNYVLYLNITHNEVDVNVHPAKHEVRFHQARLVHDFIFRAIADGIHQYFSDAPSQAGPNELAEVAPQHDYIAPLQSAPQETENTQEQIEQRPHNQFVRAPYADNEASKLSVNESQFSSGYSPATNGDTRAHQQSDNMQNVAGEAPQRNGNSAPRTATSRPGSGNSVSAQAVKGYQQLMSTNKTLSADVSSPIENHHLCLPVDDERLLVLFDAQHYVLPANALIAAHLSTTFDEQNMVAQPLLMPVSIAADKETLHCAQALYDALLNNRIEIGWSQKRIILRKVPSGMRQLPWANILPELLDTQMTTESSEKMQSIDESAVKAHLFHCIALHSPKLTPLQMHKMWMTLHDHPKSFNTLMNKAVLLPLAQLVSAHIESTH
ncbi:DNA mismatch repair protein MutL [Paraglaciecola chathamensis S18K6]|uniref:DNA mismatch repair protein MutL n=2 Tax=Paraglaciecola chathamensis TaxID=368405 RepID=A0AAV3UTD2_9ALTE|nr:DNA mismatch repair endonuclease MutL [Paraglaciecola chathamensis]GAC08360.1 DNA mismatch repair protein MutL [Paraglaciecola chathamensis S18K6]